MDKAFISSYFMYPYVTLLVIRIRQGAVSISFLLFTFIEGVLGNFAHINKFGWSFIIAI